MIEATDDPADRRRLDLLDVESGTIRTVSPPELNVWEASWAGPGRAAAVVSEEAGEDAWYGSRLVLLDVDGGSVREVYRTGRLDRQIALVAGSPSGRQVAVVQAVASDRGIVAGDVVLIDPESGDAAPVDTRDVDVTWLSWRDDDHLLYAGQRGLDTAAGEIDAGRREATELWANGESFGQRYFRFPVEQRFRPCDVGTALPGVILRQRADRFDRAALPDRFPDRVGELHQRHLDRIAEVHRA